jgi:uncharacterized protein YuzE
MDISHDKESGALYFKLRDGEYDHTEDFSEGADVYLDVVQDGNVLGLEALSFEDWAQAIKERGGNLNVPERLEKIEELAGYFHVFEARYHPDEYRWEFREAASDDVALVRTSRGHSNREELERSMDDFRAHRFADGIEKLTAQWPAPSS